jgi:hypothetical protein
VGRSEVEADVHAGERDDIKPGASHAKLPDSMPRVEAH